MNMAELNNIKLDNIGDWPIPVKAVAIALLCAGLLGGGYYLFTQEQLDRLNKVELEEVGLRDDFKKKQIKANTLEQLKRQLQEIETSFGELLKRLPNKAEVDMVLVDISQTGLASGLTFEEFKPQPERKGEGGFYMELPIRLRLTGTYHSFGKFISGVAALPRIVTQHDISIKAKSGAPGLLELDTTAKTYRYLDENEEGAGAKPKAPAAPKK